jgi:hypothetical protein
VVQDEHMDEWAKPRMKMQDIAVGGKYVVKANDNLVTVRVDAITSIRDRARYVFDVTILATNRKTTFRSLAKFLRVAVEADVT